MSRENVQIVRRVYAEGERGNFRTPEVFDPVLWSVWTRSDGRAARVVQYDDCAEALEAAGLRE